MKASLATLFGVNDSVLIILGLSAVCAFNTIFNIISKQLFLKIISHKGLYLKPVL